jgi:biofilm PGA synthesis lipoprotein PgaB
LLAANEFIAIAYHDVVDKRDELTPDGVTLDTLIDHFEWLKVNGYHPVSIEELIAAQTGIKPLPDKAVLLCWDDAYVSFYTHVLPLLKAYNYPAVLALVGSWLEPGSQELVRYGNKLVKRTKFMTWAQVKEAASSELVEIASHSNTLHSTVIANSSGGKQPAAISRIYDPATATYETDKKYTQRIRKDLQASSDQILKHIGTRPRVMVWPFGQHNMVTVQIAADTGMDITLTLNPVPSSIKNLQSIGRIYPSNNPDLEIFRSYLTKEIKPSVHHFFRVNSRDLLDPSAKTEQHFSMFLDRAKDLKPNFIILDPVIEVDGHLQSLFPNSRIPVARDRLNRFTWHISKRAGTAVYLWLSSPLFTATAGESQVTVNQFFSEMGQSAPSGGLIVDRPELVQVLVEKDTTQVNDVRFWNPDKRKLARKNMSKTGSDSRISPIFQALESFQKWQPFQEVSLVLSMNQFLNLEISQFTILLNYFDRLIINIGQDYNRLLSNNGKKQLERLHQTTYLRQCDFLLTRDSQGSAIDRDLKTLPTLNIINWGYQYDNFLEEEPPADSIRPFLSETHFPYPLPQKNR